jgi:RNA polymerase sigma-70 factor (ECF subfamily)
LEEKFKQIVAKNKNKVFNTAFGFMKNREDAEDISQEVFISVWNNLEKFREESEVSTWLYRITVNKCLDLIKKRERQNKWGKLVSFFGTKNDESKHLAHHYHPGIVTEEKEMAKNLYACIDKLPEKQKIVIVLTKMEKLNYKEVALILETTEKAVESLVARAKENLRKHLNKLYN